MPDENKYHLLPNSWQGLRTSSLKDGYRRAFTNARELYVLSAFLTEWPDDLMLNRRCEVFRLIIGTSFGTTRKHAVRAALKWLPKHFEGGILAFNQKGVTFHPKVVLWREHGGSCHLLAGSSNLTRAAFESNVEANITLRLSEADYAHARAWVDAVERRSVEVDKAWLARYEEATPPRGGSGSRPAKNPAAGEEAPVYDLSLAISGAAGRREFAGYLAARRSQRTLFDRRAKAPLAKLFRDAAAKATWSNAANEAFYRRLCELWVHTRARLGGDQWVIKGKHSNLRKLAQAFVAILDSPASARDSAVKRQVNQLQKVGVPTRGAALSELLCHFFPKDYPILDQPVRDWRSRVGFDKFVGGSEGERYLRLARAMRAALADEGPAALGVRNLAELDTLIWYHLRKRAVKPS